MEIKEEYKTEYNEKIKSIHFEIESAIIDYYSLCKIGEITNAFKYNKLTIFCTKDSLTCLEAIIQCLKKDFCLAVWCLCCDKDSSANTIPKLKNIINSKYLIEPNSIKTSTPNNKCGIFKTLIYARTKYIAHHDFNATFGKISLDDVFNKFIEFVNLFNDLLIGGELKMLYTINESKLSKLKASCENGILNLLNGDTYNFFEKIGGII